jgi:hypothetical protein
MADKVHITKHGFQALEWDADLRRYVEQEMPTAALGVLRCACHIDADVTLGEIFRSVERDRELMRFLEEWSWCNIDAVHLKAWKPAARPSGLAYIEIAKYFEWNEDGAREVIAISGVGPGGDCYAIDFTPVNEVVDLPVRLRPEMEIGNNHQKLGEAPCTFTLLEVLGEIYREISFHGSPESRDQRAAEVRESMREIEEGRAKVIPWEPPDRKVN